MQEVLRELDRWQGEGHEVALATVVGVRGSAPRPPGARLAVTRNKQMTGSVSGGCVENDVFERAMQVLDDGRPVIATYGIADEIGFEIGLSCGGSIDILIEPYTPDAAWKAAREALENEQPCTLATALSPSPLIGRKLLVREAGFVGSIDPLLDTEVADGAHGYMADGRPTSVVVPWRQAEAQIFIEPFTPPPRLYVIGATHTAIALCRIAKQLGFRVCVIDARGLFATRERFPEADEIIRDWPDRALDGLELNAFSSVVILTHDPKFDLPSLTTALRSEARYIGAMGSRATHEARKERLRELGFNDQDLLRIRAPIGLDIGARSPEEIALAILAEAVATRYGRKGRPLSDDNQPIHATQTD